jgi:hypothetical protein
MQRGLFVLKPFYAPDILGPEKVFPQPFTNLLNVQIKSSIGEEIAIDVFDGMGAIALKEKHILNTGENVIQMNTDALSSGLYILHCSGKNLDFRAKLIKGF